MTTVWPYVLIFALLQQPSFKDTQLKYERVKSAYNEKETQLRAHFRVMNIPVGNYQLFLRAFKKEEQLEVWVKAAENSTYVLLDKYPFCTSSGMLGPKRREGDGQIPEGVYRIHHFNPLSNFHLSLGINYPNASDKLLSDKHRPGGQIYIHGSCVTIGCIPITDDKIKELYLLAVEAKNGGQRSIPVHIFPTRLERGVVPQLARETSVSADIASFWANLQGIYRDFEETRKLRPVKVDGEGRYYF